MIYAIDGKHVTKLKRKGDAPDGAVVVANLNDLKDCELSTSMMCMLYNASSPVKVVKRFRTKVDAANHLWKRMNALAAHAVTSGSRRSLFSGKLLKPLVSKNPRVKGSGVAYDLWEEIWLKKKVQKDGMMFEQYLMHPLGSVAILSHEVRNKRIAII